MKKKKINYEKLKTLCKFENRKKNTIINGKMFKLIDKSKHKMKWGVLQKSKKKKNII